SRLLFVPHSQNRNPQFSFPPPSGFQHLSERNRNAALPPTAGIARSLTLSFHDSARILHDEIEREGGNVSNLVAGIREAAPVRAGFTNLRLSRDVRSARALAPGKYLFCCPLIAAQCGLHRGIGRSAGRVRLPPRARRNPPQRLPHSPTRPGNDPRQCNHGWV